MKKTNQKLNYDTLPHKSLVEIESWSCETETAIFIRQSPALESEKEKSKEAHLAVEPSKLN